MPAYDPDFSFALGLDEVRESVTLQDTPQPLPMGVIEARLSALESRLAVHQLSGGGGAAAAAATYEDENGNENAENLAPVHAFGHYNGQPAGGRNGSESWGTSTHQKNLREAQAALAKAQSVPRCMLLRVGTSTTKVDLEARATEVYADFLSGIIQVCRSKASGALSVEEMAMQRVLSEYVRNSLGGPDVIEELRGRMVEAAVDASLQVGAAPSRRNRKKGVK
jgi:hypothetical protein